MSTEPATPAASDPAARIFQAWIHLEEALRGALPVCSVQPPTQPAELLAALRIQGRLGPEEEASILDLRAIRNRIAHQEQDPPPQEADDFEAAVRTLLDHLQTTEPGGCP